MFLAMKQAGYTVAYVMTDLRLKLIRVLLATRWNYFVGQQAGFFTNAIGSEAMRASSAYQHAVLLIAGIIQVMVYGAAAVLLSWKITLVSVVIAVSLLFSMTGFIRMSRHAGEQQTEVMKSLIARLTDALQGIKPIKAMARETNLQKLLEAETEDLNKVQQRQVIAGELLKAFQEPLLMIILSIGIYVALTFGKYQFSTIFIMIILFNRAINRIYSAQSYYQAVVSGESALWSLLGSIERAEEQKEHDTEKCSLPSFRMHIMLHDVTFSYGEKPVLKNSFMEIPAGNIVAIIGPSGAGKTTIADLIIGLFQPQSGCIQIDGIPLNELNLQAWRRMIGYVPQEMFLFHDSIYNNVSLGEEKITRSDVEEALRNAGAWDFVASLSGGMDSVIGERGAKLSGGQRQRISLARALVHKPSLLILDEVTTALDPKTEAAIRDTLRDLRGKVAILIISHQSAMIEIADKIYKINNHLIDDLNSCASIKPPASFQARTL
jgi:ATP-binding cassette subfamily C protein